MCWETPRLVKAKACQQSKQPASSSKGSHSLGITRVLCPGTEHLFLETGASGVTPQPNQVSLPGLLPSTSATSFQAKAPLLPAGGIPKPNSFLALPQRATHSGTSPDHWDTNQAAEMRLGPPLLKGGNVSHHLTTVCRFSAILCFLFWCLLFHKYSYVYFTWELFGGIFYLGSLLLICKISNIPLLGRGSPFVFYFLGSVEGNSTILCGSTNKSIP